MLSSLLALFGYTINDWADKESDASAGKRNSFLNISASKALLFFVVLLFCILWLILFLKPSPLIAICIIAQVIASLVYSSAPFRLKGCGIVGLIDVILAQYILPTSIILLNLSNVILLDWLFFTCFYFVNGCCLEIGHQLYDLDRDIRTNVQTFAVSFPSGLQKKYQQLLLALAVFFSIMPFYISARLYWVLEPIMWIVFSVPLLIVIGLLLWAVYNHISLHPQNSIDPFYHSQGNVIDRFYTYFPNCFMPIFLSIWITITIPYGWIYLFFILIWIKLSMFDKAITWHVNEIRYLCLPPELVGKWKRNKKFHQ